MDALNAPPNSYVLLQRRDAVEFAPQLDVLLGVEVAGNQPVGLIHDRADPKRWLRVVVIQGMTAIKPRLAGQECYASPAAATTRLRELHTESLRSLGIAPPEPDPEDQPDPITGETRAERERRLHPQFPLDQRRIEM